jgi:hypothetical protein
LRDQHGPERHETPAEADWKDRGGAPEQKGGAPHAEQKYKTELRQLMQSSFTKLEGAKWFGEGTVFTVRTLKTAGKNFVIPPWDDVLQST